MIALIYNAIIGDGNVTSVLSEAVINLGIADAFPVKAFTHRRVLASTIAKDKVVTFTAIQGVIAVGPEIFQAYGCWVIEIDVGNVHARCTRG